MCGGGVADGREVFGGVGPEGLGRGDGVSVVVLECDGDGVGGGVEG